MTMGQRIAQKRREAGLSQEALGEQLGVSRQSIYKWEADAALPEIKKLVALSQRFGVSVGWLLGVEETAPAGETEACFGGAAAASERQLTDAQLKMVEEIVDRYLAAQTAPKPRRRWLWVLGVVVLLFTLAHFYEQMEAMRQQNENIQNNISQVEQTVYHQINGISGRVEEILKAQNSLTAEYGTEIQNIDLEQNRITFAVYAVPKTYVEGMQARFSVQNGKKAIELDAADFKNQAFSADIACELTDDIGLSVMFLYPDGTQQNQLLDSYQGLFYASFPKLHMMDHQLFAAEVPNGVLMLEDFYITAREWNDPDPRFREIPEIAEIRIGLFRNRKLVAWAEPCETPDSFHGFDDHRFYRIPDLRVENITTADTLEVAALITDDCGRQFMACEAPYVLQTKTDRDHPYLTYASDGRTDPDPAHWEFS